MDIDVDALARRLMSARLQANFAEGYEKTIAIAEEAIERCRGLEEALQSMPSPPIRGERLTAFGWFTYSGWLQWVVDARAALKERGHD